MAALPPPGTDPRALALLAALRERADARVALSETLMEMEARLARVEPVPVEVLHEYERRMARLRDVQDRVASLATSA